MVLQIVLVLSIFAGQPDLELTASTIAQNQADASKGHIFNLSNAANIILLSTLSQVYLQSNTIVENKAWSTLFYDNYPRINLAFNMLAFNQGKSCRYALPASLE